MYSRSCMQESSRSGILRQRLEDAEMEAGQLLQEQQALRDAAAQAEARADAAAVDAVAEGGGAGGEGCGPCGGGGCRA